MLGCLWLSSCTPFPEAGSEEKNPLIGDARAKKGAYNYAGAVDSLKKALEGNPRLALAHWELGLIYCQNVPNPAAAIYHFEELLRLRPDWRQAETARQMINVCKIELAKNVPLGPQAPAIQQQLDRLTAKVHELTNDGNKIRTQNQALQLQVQQLMVENAQLKEKLRVAPAAPVPAPGATPPTAPAAGRPAGPGPDGSVGASATEAASTANPTSPGPGAASPAARGSAGRGLPAPVAPAAPNPPKVRSHTIQSGDTLARIAQRYGLKTKALIAANPSLNPQRLKVGQVIRIPEP